MSAAISTGITLGLSGTLLIASITKLVRLQRFEAALVGLIPAVVWRSGLTSRTLARIVVAAEFATALLLLGFGGRSVGMAVWIVLLTTVFLGAALRAGRLRRSCGCFATTEVESSGLEPVVRSGFLVLAALVLIALSPSEFRLTPLGAALATLVLAVGCWPLVRAVAQRAVTRRIANAGTPERDFDTSTRRGFLGTAGKLVGSALVFTTLGAQSAMAGGGGATCAAKFDLCYGCTTKVTGEGDVGCCISCYGACQTFPIGCPSGSCGGCWP